MDQQGHKQPPALGVAASVPFPSAAAAPYQGAYQHLYQQQQPQQQLQFCWADQYREIEQTTDFENRNFPLACIKKIMKDEADVRMIAVEAPVVFARACEMLTFELTHRGWANAEENKRTSLQKNDIAAAITRTDVFDFLADIVPREDEAVPREIPSAPVNPLSYYVQQ